MLAAACLYALEHHVDRLADDHQNALELATALGGIPGLFVVYLTHQTNMVFVSMESAQSEGLNEFMAARGIIMRGGATTRLVTHLDVKKEHIQVVADAFREFLGR